MTLIEPCPLKLGDIFTTKQLKEENPFFICGKCSNDTIVASRVSLTSTRICTLEKNQHIFASMDSITFSCHKYDIKAHQIIELAQHEHRSLYYKSKFQVRLNISKIPFSNEYVSFKFCTELTLKSNHRTVVENMT